MKRIGSENKLCLMCMEEHEVYTVEVVDNEVFKGEEVSFTATYEYCDHADEYIETEEMIRANSLAMKDAYRQKMGLLTSKEIINIRDKYCVSQKDFSEILDWGGATITRYENHQVQDRAHDDILRKIDKDPKWFLEMLARAKSRISEKAYNKYYKEATERFKNSKNQYIIDSIYAMYTDFNDEAITGKIKLSLNKVVEMINYLAAKVPSLHKVKLMKMLWYCDNLHYKRHGEAISGLAYYSLQMGAVPVGYEEIVLLNGVTFETIQMDDFVSYRFSPTPGIGIKELTESEIQAMDDVIASFGDMKTKEIVDTMHNEKAYQCTEIKDIIPFSYADELSIS